MGKAVFSGVGMGELFIIFLTKRLSTYCYTHRLYCKFDYFYRGQVGKIKSSGKYQNFLGAADGLEGADSERARYQIRAWKRFPSKAGYAKTPNRS